MMGVAAGCTPKAGPNFDAGPPVGTEILATDCTSAEQGLEFAPFTIFDFEAPTAQFMYSYVDGTSTVSPAGYQPPTAPAPRCFGEASNRAFHIQGGPFLGWGGGMGLGLQHINQLYCNTIPLPSFCPPPSAGEAVAYAALDVSQWEGVALWARRGPGSQPLLRVLVGNKYTDDDISFLMYQGDPKTPRYCERVRECGCTYMNKPCTATDGGTSGAPDGGFYCGKPGEAPGPAIMEPISGTGNQATNTCNTTRCNDRYPAFPDRIDTQFDGRKCTPATSRNGLQTSFCWDPDGDPTATPPRAPDPEPAQSDQQCGDHWTYPLHVTTEWQLYLVPFSTMYQQGFGKRWTSFDLTSASLVRMTWDKGPIDYWVDNVRFYKRAAKKP